MAKGEETRNSILAQAAQLFTTRGYSGASIEELTKATGLTKGGIYNHFGNKDELALQAFDYAVEQANVRFRATVPRGGDSRSRLLGVVNHFQSLIDDPLFVGGCPLLNTAVDADDTHPALRDRTRTAVSDWRNYICRTIIKGKELGTVKADTDPEMVASFIIAALEGAVMLAKLYDDPAHIHRVTAQLTFYVNQIVIFAE